MPRPRRRSLAPLEVPGGTVTVTGPSMVGTCTFAPSAASATVTGTASSMSMSCRCRCLSGVTSMSRYRSPGAPPLPGAGEPLPATRRRAPDSPAAEGLREGIGIEALRHAVRPHGRVFEAKVLGTLGLVRQHIVRLVDLLEAFGLLLVAAGYVRVKFLGQLAVGLLDGGFVGVLGAAQDLEEDFHV